MKKLIVSCMAAAILALVLSLGCFAAGRTAAAGGALAYTANAAQSSYSDADKGKPYWSRRTNRKKYVNRHSNNRRNRYNRRNRRTRRW